MLGHPLPAAAQDEAAFVQALADFTAALPGTFGDEAVQARDALDRLERGLAEWDARLREYEANVAEIRPTASPRRVLDMHATMGRFYFARGRLDDAIREFEAAVALAPDEALLHLWRGLVHEAAARPADALQAFRQAWELDSANPMLAYMLADASFRSASPAPLDGALAALTEAIDRIVGGQRPVSPAPFPETAFLPDDVSEAPLFVPARYVEAFALLERARYAEAIEAMRHAASRDPLLAAPPPDVMRSGADALRQGRVADAVAHFTAAVRDAPGSEAHRMLGVVHWLSAQFERSIEHLEQAIRLDPTDERSRLTLARVLDEIGETERTERLLVETTTAFPSSALAWWRLGRLHASANRSEDALRAYEAAVGIGAPAGEAPLRLEMGALYRRGLDAGRTEAAFAAAVALRPNDGVAHRERGRALLHLDRTDAAFVELAAAVLVDSDDYESWFSIGQIYLDGGRYTDAARVLTYATGIDPDNPEAYYALATALVRSGDGDAAAGHLETFARLQAAAIETQRRRIDASVLRLEASVLAEQGALDRTVELWTRLLAEEPDVAANHAGLAAALARLGQVETAAAHYEKAVALGAAATVHRQLAALYDSMGRPEAGAQARARLARVRLDALDPSSPAH